MAGEGVPIMTAMVESMGYGVRATVGEGAARVSNFFCWWSSPAAAATLRACAANDIQQSIQARG